MQNRLDIIMVERGVATTRSQALNLIKIGKVQVNDMTVLKAGYEVGDNDIIVVNNDIKSSIGCYKLEHAIETFMLKGIIDNAICMDVGASNGGFTTILLENHAKKVYAVDVAANALPKEISCDKRVVVVDNTNARSMQFESIGEQVDVITIDVSFVSLKLIIPNILQFIKPDGIIIALLKPQFELGKQALSKSGIVQDERKITALVEDYSEFLSLINARIVDQIPVPKLFQKKNTEILLYIKK